MRTVAFDPTALKRQKEIVVFLWFRRKEEIFVRPDAYLQVVDFTLHRFHADQVSESFFGRVQSVHFRSKMLEREINCLHQQSIHLVSILLRYDVRFRRYGHDGQEE